MASTGILIQKNNWLTKEPYDLNHNVAVIFNL